MVTAYILAKVDAGQDQKVLDKVKNQLGIEEANSTYGVYDLFLKITLNKVDDLDTFVFEKLRKISGVQQTVTMIAR